MLTINLKEEVQKAVALEWPKFAAEHPRLAEAIDQSVLVEQATTSLADDPAYRAAMENAAAAGGTGEAIIALIAQFVGDWIKRLI